jgi:isocitrate lyase
MAKSSKWNCSKGVEVLGEMSPAFAEILHQHEVSTGYFDDVAQVIAGGQTSTTALGGSTELEQFH